MRRPLIAYATLLLILAVAAWLRFADLGGPSLWDDEMHTIVFSQRPLATMWQQSAQKDSNPLGFYLLLHVWLRHGDGEAFFRFWPALLGTLAVLAVFWLAATLYDRNAGLWAAALAAFHPLSIYCSREVRAHTATLLLAVLATTFLARLLSRGRWLDAAGYLLCLGLALHLHYYAFLLVGGHLLLLSWLLWRDLRRARRGLRPTLALAGMAALQRNAQVGVFGNTLAAGAMEAHRARLRGIVMAFAAIVGATILFLPFFKVFAFQLLRGQAWRPSTTLPEVLARGFLYLAYAATPDRLPTFGLSWEGAHAIAWTMLAWFLFAVPFAVALILGLLDKTEREARTITTGLLIGPWLLLFAAILVSPVFDIRHALALMPPALVLAAGGLANLARKTRIGATVLGLLIAAPMLLAIHQERHDPSYARQDWRGAAAQVCREKREGDLALAYHAEKAYAFRFYARACGLRVEDLFDDEVYRMDLEKRRAAVSQRLDELEKQAQRIWLVDYHGAVFDPLDLTREKLKRDGFYLVRRSVYDRGVKHFVIDLFTRDQTEAVAAFGPAIDFARPYNPGQLLSGWYPPGENGAWTAATAEALLRQTGQQTIHVAAYVHRPFYPAPVALRLLVGDAPVAEQVVNQTGLVTLSGRLPSLMQNGLLRARLEVHPTFIPAEVLNTADRTPKGVLVQRIWLE